MSSGVVASFRIISPQMTLPNNENAVLLNQFSLNSKANKIVLAINLLRTRYLR